MEGNPDPALSFLVACHRERVSVSYTIGRSENLNSGEALPLDRLPRRLCFGRIEQEPRVDRLV